MKDAGRRPIGRRPQTDAQIGRQSAQKSGALLVFAVLLGVFLGVFLGVAWQPCLVKRCPWPAALLSPCLLPPPPRPPLLALRVCGNPIRLSFDTMRPFSGL